LSDVNASARLWNIRRRTWLSTLREELLVRFAHPRRDLACSWPLASERAEMQAGSLRYTLRPALSDMHPWQAECGETVDLPNVMW